MRRPIELSGSEFVLIYSATFVLEYGDFSTPAGKESVLYLERGGRYSVHEYIAGFLQTLSQGPGLMGSDLRASMPAEVELPVTIAELDRILTALEAVAAEFKDRWADFSEATPQRVQMSGNEYSAVQPLFERLERQIDSWLPFGTRTTDNRDNARLVVHGTSDGVLGEYLRVALPEFYEELRIGILHGRDWGPDLTSNQRLELAEELDRLVITHTPCEDGSVRVAAVGVPQGPRDYAFSHVVDLRVGHVLVDMDLDRRIMGFEPLRWAGGGLPAGVWEAHCSSGKTEG